MLTPYVALDYDFEYVNLSILNVHVCSFIWCFNGCSTSVKEINRYIKQCMFFYLMILMDILLQLKKWIGKAMCVLLFDVFNGCPTSIKEVKR